MKYALIGEKLSHSYSKTIHNLLGNNDYELCELSRDEIGEFLKKREFKGLNVTIPYKKTVMSECVLSEGAREIGSVNTIVNKDGVLYGYNTDADGFSYMAKRAGISFENKKVLVLGSGGASNTAKYVAKCEGAFEVIVISRSGEDNYENIYERHSDADIIVNTTPVGMYPNTGESAVDIDKFSDLCGVIDLIYNPLNTKLILDAKKNKIKCTGGISMLVVQAVSAHRHFFDSSFEIDAEAIIRKIERQFMNIVLIGMPGVGKSTLGKLIAEKLGRKFVDSDEEITSATGCLPGDIIKAKGEDEFRKIESEIISKITKEKGIVIATGGGSILREENRKALMENGYILYLERELESLEKKGRPLSADLEGLFKARKPIYEAMCDTKVRVGPDRSETAQQIEFLVRE